MKHAETSALVAAIRGPFWIWLVSTCHSWLHTVQMRSDLTFGRSTWLLTIKIRRCRFLNQLQCSPSQQRLPNTQGKAEWHSWIHGISMAFPWHLKIFGYICMQSPYYVAFFWNSFCRWWCNFCCNAESKTLFSSLLHWRQTHPDYVKSQRWKQRRPCDFMAWSRHFHGISIALPKLVMTSRS